MKSLFVDKKARNEFLEGLEARFLNKEYLTLSEMVVEFYNPKNELDIRIATDRVITLVSTVKNRLKRKGIWFGVVDDEGHFGILTTTAQSQYVQTKYYQRVRGTVIRASQAQTESHLKGLLSGQPKVEKLLLPTAEKYDK